MTTLAETPIRITVSRRSLSFQTQTPMSLTFPQFSLYYVATRCSRLFSPISETRDTTDIFNDILDKYTQRYILQDDFISFINTILHISFNVKLIPERIHIFSFYIFQ